MTPEARIELLAYRLKEYILAKPPWPPDLTPLDEIATLARGIQGITAGVEREHYEGQAQSPQAH